MNRSEAIRRVDDTPRCGGGTRAARVAAFALTLALVAATHAPARAQAGGPPATAADTAAGALQRAAVLDGAGELLAARRVAQKAIALGGGATAHVAAGWYSYRLGDTDVALYHYRAALEETPESENALLGETLVLALREDWPALRASAATLVRHHPKQPWGWVRLGLAAYAQGEAEVAGAAYRKALDLLPDMAEAHLGLGFVARSQGDLDAARAHCQQAALHLESDDPRVAACLAPPERRLTVLPGAWGLVTGYSDYYTRDLVWSVAAETELLWPGGLGLYVAAAVSRTQMRFESSDFTQLLPVLGVSYTGADWSLAATYTFIWQSGAAGRLEHVPVVGARGWTGRWGFGGELAALVAPGEEAMFQALLPLSWGRPGDTFRVTLTPSAQYWAQGEADTEGGESRDGTFYAAGALDLTWQPAEWLVLELGGWYGRRRSFVEPGGRFAWNSDDVLQGGARVAASFRVARSVWLNLRLRDDFGVEQAGRAFDFQMLTAQAGIVLEF